MQKIVIVGAGFAGLQTALKLSKRLDGLGDFQINLISERDYHLFSPNLYEAATAEEELVSQKQLRLSLTWPLKELLAKSKINFVQGRLKRVVSQKRQLELEAKVVSYDYLILALGSVTDYFGISGMPELALTLKDLPDALRFRNQAEFVVQSHRLDANKKILRFVLVGGGYTGVELAGEMSRFLKFIAWKNDYPWEKIQIELIDANAKLVSGFDDRMSRDAYNRLRDLNVDFRLGSRVAGVESGFVSLMDGQRLSYDCLFWAAGVRAKSLEFDVPQTKDNKDRLEVDGSLRLVNDHRIFALGDMALIKDRSGRPAPATAQDAWDQAKYLAKAFPLLLANRKPAPYRPKQHGFILNVGTRWAILSHRGLYLTGYLAFVADKFAHLRYYLSLQGLWPSLKRLFGQYRMFD